MNFKKIITGIACLFATFSGIAQDKIYKKSGDVVDAKIKNVGEKEITYLRFDNPTGPEYIVLKGEVQKIVYQNGTTDKFDDAPVSRFSRFRGNRHLHPALVLKDNDDNEVKLDYKPSVLSLSPFQFTENGLGLSLSYERVLDKEGIIAFYMPVAATFNLNNGTYTDNNGNIQNGHDDAMIYAMPGLKIYPTGAYGIVKYSIGLAAVLGTGQKSTPAYSNYPYNYGLTSYQTQDHEILGMIINNGVNFNPSAHIYLGIELGMGFTYLNREGGYNMGTEFLVQGGVKIGYRF